MFFTFLSPYSAIFLNPEQSVSLSRRVDLLFECIPKANGQRFRYEDVKAVGGLGPAATSRIRRGQILEPTMSSLAGLAKTFGVSMDYFVIEGSEDELRRYLDNERTIESALGRIAQNGGGLPQ